jgi:hypothetical protein
MGRARAGMVTEGEGVVAGLRKLEEETAFDKYVKAAQAGMGQECARSLREKGGAGGAAWAERPVGLAGLRGRVGRLAAGPNEGKILFRIKFDF